MQSCDVGGGGDDDGGCVTLAACGVQVDYWLHSLQARVPGVPVVIVGTHLDLYTKATKKKKKKDGTCHRSRSLMSLSVGLTSYVCAVAQTTNRRRLTNC
jgi:hypothetical protein